MLHDFGLNQGYVYYSDFTDNNDFFTIDSQRNTYKININKSNKYWFFIVLGLKAIQNQRDNRNLWAALYNISQLYFRTFKIIFREKSIQNKTIGIKRNLK